MGYLLITLAMFLNLVKAFASKKLSRRAECVADNIDLSILRNLFCVAVGALFIAFANGADFSIPLRGILICVLAGAVMSVNYVAWVMALKTDAIVFASTANNANFIVVGALGILVFNEHLSLYKGIAILLIFAAMFFMVKFQKGIGGAPKLRDAVLLLLVFLFGGFSSVTEKCFSKYVVGVSSHIYTFYAFLFAVLWLLAARIFIRPPKGVNFAARKEKLVGFLPYAVVMGIAIYGVTYFKTLANSYLDTIVLYPLNNGLTLVGSCIMAWICFNEKPNKNSIIGMILIFLALLFSSGTAEKIIERLAA